MRNKKGFTLVEILIVVVILGILAAIVIPQFSDASTQAKTSSLASDLQTVRSQIQLYKIQHNDDLPGVINGAAATAATFAAALTGTSDIDGDPTGTDYGPYLQKIPTNQFNDSASVRITAAAAGSIVDSTDGWRYDITTGDFNADDDVAATPAHSSL